MSWGATGFTPIVTYNVPPFGFAELPTMPDFKVCNENPWSTADRVKADIQDALLVQEYRKSLHSKGLDGPLLGEPKYDKAKELKCLTDTCNEIQEQFTMPFNDDFVNDFFPKNIVVLLFLLFLLVVVVLITMKYKK